VGEFAGMDYEPLGGGWDGGRPPYLPGLDYQIFPAAPSPPRQLARLRDGSGAVGGGGPAEERGDRGPSGSGDEPVDRHRTPSNAFCRLWHRITCPDCERGEVRESDPAKDIRDVRRQVEEARHKVNWLEEALSRHVRSDHGR
jgi:hypothetical protein